MSVELLMLLYSALLFLVIILVLLVRPEGLLGTEFKERV